MAAPLSRRTLPAVLRRIHRVLAAHRAEVDGLNVFPVPDGDTGTNLAHTIRAALEDLGDDDGDRTGEIAVRGALRGARGNSGVILSQVVRALAETLVDDDPIDGHGFARFLDRARALAYEAVSDPIEGTILTALTVAAETATGVADQELPAVVRKVCDDVHLAVARTPEQLEVLRRAGVVDAGARGLELVLGAIHGHVTGQDVETATLEPAAELQGGPGDDRGSERAPSRYRYEVQYLLEAEDRHAGDLRTTLRGIGDSVAVVASGGLLNVHVHTDDIGPAIEAGARLGRPSDIEVVAFADQTARRVPPGCTREDAPAAGGTAEGEEAPQRRIGCVAVLPGPGPGLRAVAEELGAVVVDGAAGALPSVADVLNAVGSVRAARVAILPGHRNAVPTARQAAQVSAAEGGRDLAVVATADTPPAVLSALAVCEPSADPDDVIDDMWAAAGAVRSGEVVAAVRTSDTPLGEVREGQFLAVVDGEVVSIHDDPVEALVAVAADGLGEPEPGGIVTVCIGADVAGEERGRVVDRLDELFPEAEVEVVDGGQRPARYHLGVA